MNTISAEPPELTVKALAHSLRPALLMRVTLFPIWMAGPPFLVRATRSRQAVSAPAPGVELIRRSHRLTACPRPTLKPIAITAASKTRRFFMGRPSDARQGAERVQFRIDGSNIKRMRFFNRRIERIGD